MINTKRKAGFFLFFFTAVIASLAVGTGARAQTPEPPVATPASAPSAPADAVPLVPAASAPAPVESCRIVTDRAMAADLRAANAQSDKADAQQMGRLLDDAIGLWTLASERCTDRAQERARRNLSDSQRSRQALSAEIGAGPECAGRQKDANSLQDLAQQAVKARRWLDAAVLYRKAENMWDVAAERCSGEPQKLAIQRRDQTAIDAHNAEFCAPGFERAREASQALGRLNDPALKAARQTQTQVAETLWRDAIAQCKGQPQEIAQSSAQRLAKERGTPWVPTQAARTEPATTTTAPATRLAPTTASGSAAAATAAPQAAAAAGGGLLGSLGTAVGNLLPSSQPTAPQTTPPSGANATAATGPQDTDIQSGDTRFQGRFVRQGNLLTGSGRVTWANGDAYNGELLQGKRHGQGEFVWANGQRFRGDWVQDVPHGKGSVKFATGNQYDGDIAQGEPHGEGRMVFASGDSFQGRFVKGKPEGQGTYRWTSGQTYEGPWSRDNPNGTGKLAYANGNRYEGPLVNGVPDGLGKLVFASGDEYRGQFSQGSPQGEGTYTWTSGDRYTGQWQAGRKHGQGRFEWPNGDRWEGLFQNDTQTDKGTLTRKTP